MKLGAYIASAAVAFSATTAFASGESSAMDVAIASDACNGATVVSAEFLPSGQVGVTCADDVAAAAPSGKGAGIIIGGLLIGGLLAGSGSGSSSSGTN